MFHPKRFCSCMFGVVILIFSALHASAQTNVSSPTTAVCLIGDNPGIDDSDARTAAMLVCDELRKQGISVTDPVFEAPVSADVYRVVLRRLGGKVIVRLSQENPIGTIIAERQITLANIEEMIPAAPRLVDALIHGKAIDATVDMESVVEQEARELRKITGESLWNFGVIGTIIPGTDIVGDAGFQLGWYFEMPSFAAGTDMQFSGNGRDENNDGFLFFTWSVGGRYFLAKQNISPYVGGGLAFVAASYDPREPTTEPKEIPSQPRFNNEWWEDDYHYEDPYYYSESEEDTGLGIYGVAGIEMLRLTQSRLNLELRVDRPFFRLESQDMMPITIGLSFAYNFNMFLF